MKPAQLIRVDTNDQPLGSVEKMTAHREGILHRAFSIFLFNKDGKWLLQQRAAGKYHSAGLWTNACCGHPVEGEQILDAAHARLLFEMGMECKLTNMFNFIYRAQLANGLVEHEFDHVFIGFSEDAPRLNHDEAGGWRSVSIQELRSEIRAGEERFTEWFKMIYERVYLYYNQNYSL